MISAVVERFERWTRAETPADPIRRFRIAFASIWLVYDVLDIAFHGTAVTQWIGGRPTGLLTALQALLVVSELGLLLGLRPRACALAAFFLRAVVAWKFFALNDFFYFCVTALVLAQFRLEGDREQGWPRDVLIWQTAWIYFATALLKTSRVWLSGGHLFVRQEYLAATGWPYPAFYRSFISALAGNAILAWMGIAMEFLLAGMLLFRAPRRWALALAVAVHGFAALTVNVWFFGASMIAKVAFLLQ